MSRPLTSRGFAARVAVLALFTPLTALSFALVNSSASAEASADIDVRNRPASEGRTITPAGSLVTDLTTGPPAVGSLPVAFVRSPDAKGPRGLGRYLVAVNSGYGLQFSAATNKGQQSLSVIDLSLREPSVVQNVYFPTPQSANVGAAFSPRADSQGFYKLYVSGGYENRVWVFNFRPGDVTPVTPVSPGPGTKVDAPFIDLNGVAASPAHPRYNWGRAAVYPAGLAVGEDGRRLFVANNLDDSLAVVFDPEGARQVTRIPLNRKGDAQPLYPY